MVEVIRRRDSDILEKRAAGSHYIERREEPEASVDKDAGDARKALEARATSPEIFQVWNPPATEALAGQKTDFNLSLIKPAAVFGM
jgi:hypothetical protein